MKASTMKTRNLLLALPCALLAINAWSTGSHAGGHGHDDEEAIGKPGVVANVTRTIKVDMTDAMRFKASNIAVKQGETIRFAVSNSGKLKHEMVLGTEKELKEHSEAMKKNPEMEHADANMLTLAPGKSGEIVWQFTRAGKVNFACLQPGHYDAGMKGVVTVAAGKGAAGGKDMAAKELPATAATTATTVAAAAQPGAAPAEMTEGEVRKVDKANGKITLKHGAITNLDMPPMTMVFSVSDAAALEKLSVGDKVLFRAGKQGGSITVTEIRSAK